MSDNSRMNITEFLEARIAEDERAACKLAEADRRPLLSIASTINHPQRLFAECAAKRAIIEQHKDWPVLVEKKPEFREDSADPQSMAYRVTQEMVWLTEREYVKRFGIEAPTTNMIRALAAVYKDHPDYQQEWNL